LRDPPASLEPALLPPPDPEAALAPATDVAEAAAAAVEHLLALGLDMPSVYIQMGGRLRCLAHRGYWQVHDGVPVELGIIGATFRAGGPSVVPDVTMVDEFVAGGQGVIAQVAYPLRSHGQVIGVLNAESRRPLSARDAPVVAECAAALGRRIGALGGVPVETRWQAVAREAAAFARLRDPELLAARAVAQACALSGYSSAALVVAGRRLTVAATLGPLGPAFTRMPQATLADIAGWPAGESSVYTSGSYPGVGYAGTQQLLAAGVAALICSPLPSEDGQGFLMVADELPRRPDTDDVRLLELFAATVASALQAAEAFAELHRQAARDPLTGLGHNRTFRTHLEAATGKPEPPGVAVILIDLDRFKAVNDTDGHLAGDRVLVDVANALRRGLRGADRAYRIGGDEFAAIVHVQSLEEAVGIGERLRAQAAATGHTTVSVGVAFSDGSDAEAEMLQSDADLALYEAKRAGRDRVAAFRPTLRSALVERARLAAQLEGAIARGDLYCQFQPVVDLPDGELLGAEALVRWRHPTRGLVPPLEFIPIAEEDGLIAELGALVLRQTCRLGAEANRDRNPESLIKFGLNVSGLQLEPAFVRLVQDVLAETGLPADALVIEITESGLVADAARVDVLAAVRDLGAHVAVDDFGTGYSSLSYLRTLPIDILKIDRSFVAQLDDQRNAAIARTIVELAHTLGLSTVAEGVETPEQSLQLHMLGCDHAQGYLFDRPLAPRDLLTRIRAAGPVGQAVSSGPPPG
jgi:diguanylate cyclase